MGKPNQDMVLHENKEIFQLMVEGLKDYAIFMLDVEGNITSWNTGAEKIKGYHSNEIIGRHFSCFYPKDDIEKRKPWNELKIALKEGRYEEEGWRVRKDGTQFWADVIITPIINENGILQGYTKVTRDITDKKESETKFRGILESAPDAMVILGQNGKIQLVNAQTEKMFGFKREEMIGMEVELLIPERFRHKHTHHRHDFFEAPKTRGMGIGLELFGKRKDSSEFPLEISLSPLVLENEGTIVLASIRDITQRKTSEDEIKKLNEELKAFSYSVSHDLRSPLRSIDGFSNLILKNYADLLDEQGKDYFKRIMNASRHMGQLIDDLLKLSRLTLVELNIETINFSEIAESIISELRVSSPERKATVNIQKNMTINADRNLIRIALENLLGNAWKYTKNQNETKIEFGTIIMDGNKTVYFIRDNGVGFEMKYVNKLFGVFQRLHSNADFEGTGIGLATVQRIIRSHKGNIWAEGEINKGATFYFVMD